MPRRSFDALLLALLLIARVRIDTLTDLVLPTRLQDVAREPTLHTLIPPQGYQLLSDWLSDPLTLILISGAFGVLLLYLIVDLSNRSASEISLLSYRLKLALVWAIIVLTVFLPTGKLILLRLQSGPASYTHDGGVIQTESTIQFLLQGKNPYIENYLDTPLREWGLDLHTALYHFPYLPWTFLFSTPFYLLSRALLGWYDQRFVYLILFAIALVLTPTLAGPERRARLGLLMLLGLNPIMANDVIFGQNDSFILSWLIISLVLLVHRHPRWSAVALGLACASKPTAWFMVPFWTLLLWQQSRLAVGSWQLAVSGQQSEVANQQPATGNEPSSVVYRLWSSAYRPSSILAPLAILALVTLLITGPYLVWDANAMVDDVWRWAAGTSDQPYQIRGWGLSNFVLALGWVKDRQAYWPFWIPQVIISTPLLLIGLWRQWRQNTLANALWGYALLLFGFFYTSRFLNENYTGFLLALFAISYFGQANTSIGITPEKTLTEDKTLTEEVQAKVYA